MLDPPTDPSGRVSIRISFIYVYFQSINLGSSRSKGLFASHSNEIKSLPIPKGDRDTLYLQNDLVLFFF